MLFSLARLSGGRPRVGTRGAYLVHDLDRLTLVADEPLPFQVDGDALDLREKVTFRSVPHAIEILGISPESG
jgi:diacylglycerol kinase family enzyme